MIAWFYPILLWGLVASLLVALAQKCIADRGPRWLPLFGAAAVLIPFQGIPIGRFLHGLTFGFSLPSFALILHVIGSAHIGRPLFSKSTHITMCVVGTVFGATLYPTALGLGTFDIYALGWTSDKLTMFLIFFTAVLIWTNNTFGYVLILSAAAWQIGLLESTNIWDYLVDPVYFLSSIAGLVAHSFDALTRRRRRRACTNCTTNFEAQLRTAA